MTINQNTFTTDRYYLSKRIDKDGYYIIDYGMFFDKEKTKVSSIAQYKYTNRDSAYACYYRIKKRLERV